MSDLRDSRITEQLAEYGLSTSFARLPDEVIDRAKRVITDELGCMVLGSTLPPGIRMRSYVTSVGGTADATIIGGGVKVPAAFAALSNGTSAHADELDGVHICRAHPGSTMVPAAVALCEMRGLSGKELINAVTLSYDIGCRLVIGMGGGAKIKAEHHQHPVPLFAPGVATAAGRLLGLEQLQVQHAMSLASLCIAIPNSFFDERNHMSKAMNQGQAAYAGVTGALLASHGFEAHDGFVEAKDGLIDVWRTSDMDLDILTAGLGEEFSIMQAGFKYYSAGYPIHAPLFGALELMKEFGLTADSIERVRVGISPSSAETVAVRKMASISLPDMVSLGMVRGGLTFDIAHDETALASPEVRRLRDAIEIVRDDSLTWEAEHRPGWVEFETKDGKSYRGPKHVAPGHWDHGGMPWDHLHEKFDSLVAPRLGAEASARAFSFCERLEQQDSLEPLILALSRAK